MPDNRAHILRRPLLNLTCPYCYVDLASTTANKEHVVGRRFVPKGTLHQSESLILRACEDCNNRKSDLEDDISAISMQPDLALGFAARDPQLIADAKRKGEESRDRLSGRPISSCVDQLTNGGSLVPGVHVSFTLVCPPQLDNELAHYQARGFFYALSYDTDARRGYPWPGGGFFPVTYSPRTDWGNVMQRWFMQTVATWQPRVVGPLARGYFQVAIRRNPAAEVWSCAFEWNRTVRVIAFFGHHETIMDLAKQIPTVPLDVVGRYPGGGELRMRPEIALAEADDVLFAATVYDKAAQSGDEAASAPENPAT